MDDLYGPEDGLDMGGDEFSEIEHEDCDCPLCKISEIIQENQMKCGTCVHAVRMCRAEDGSPCCWHCEISGLEEVRVNNEFFCISWSPRKGKDDEP